MTNKASPKTVRALLRAAKKYGGQAALARELGIAPVNVTQWIKGKRPVPVAQCVALEQKLPGLVKRQDLRPHDYQELWPDLVTEPAQSSVGDVLPLSPSSLGG